jgi:hypothetical protein
MTLGQILLTLAVLTVMGFVGGAVLISLSSGNDENLWWRAGRACLAFAIVGFGLLGLVSGIVLLLLIWGVQ